MLALQDIGIPNTPEWHQFYKKLQKSTTLASLVLTAWQIGLYEPVSEYDTVEGEFGHLTVPSLTDWFDRHPPIKWGAVGVLGLAGLAFLASQMLSNEEQL